MRILLAIVFFVATNAFGAPENENKIFTGNYEIVECVSGCEDIIGFKKQVKDYENIQINFLDKLYQQTCDDQIPFELNLRWYGSDVYLVPFFYNNWASYDSVCDSELEVSGDSVSLIAESGLIIKIIKNGDLFELFWTAPKYSIETNLVLKKTLEY